MAVLTDGQEWSIYLPAEQGSYEERRVYKLDLLERTPAESEQRLRRYLERDRVLSGQSLVDARADYTDAARGRQVLSTLPIAWERLLRDRDELLLELLADKVEDICGFRPSADDCAGYLVQRTVPTAQPASLPAPKRHRITPDSDVDVLSLGPSYTIEGRSVHTRSAREVLEGLIGVLSDRDASFLERLAARRHGRRRRYIARDRYELYPDRRDLAESHSVEVRPGWWLGTNYSCGGIIKILNLACEVAGLRRNQDIWFSVE